MKIYLMTITLKVILNVLSEKPCFLHLAVYNDLLSPNLVACFQVSLCIRKPTIWVPTRYDTNQALHAQKNVTSLKFQI